MFKDNEILLAIRDLYCIVDELNNRFDDISEKFDHFIVTERQYREQMGNPEAKILAEENEAYKIGYEKGYRDAKQHELLLNSLGDKDAIEIRIVQESNI